MISFVIPVKNEGANIRRCVESIRRHVPKGEPFEVLVVDNGSTDDTAALAKAAGARVITSTARTIAKVRNEGVAATTGDLLFFIDGDCALTPAWEREIPPVLAKVRALPVAGAGSHPIPPPGEDVFLWKHWFVPLFQQPATSHIGTAHLMCRRDAFERLGGFDETLVTDEDFEFCMRIKKAGGPILVEQQLTVEHYGFPRTWSHFFRRERWHGKGSAQSLMNVLTSKVALLSVLFALGAVTAVVAALLGSWRVFGAGLLAVLAVPGASAVAKFRHHGLTEILVATPIFGVFYAAHALSIVDALLKPASRRS